MIKNEKIKVLYFAGSGRSGSTILNIILGNHPNIVGGGELQNMGTVYNDQKFCSCQEPLINCEFWSSVMNDWNSKIDDNIEFGLKRWNSIEKVFSFKTWFKMYFGIGHDSKEFQDYLNSTTEFYRALQFHSKKEIVVDISKNPLRAWALEKNPNIDLRMVHLVRDGRAVAWSLKKNAKEQNRKRPTWRAAMFWVIINRMTDLVRNKVENKVLIKYEDLISDPASVLNQIESMSDVDLSSIIDKIDRNDDFKIEHVMAGNAIRKADTIKFQTSKADGWKNKLKPFDNNLFKCISINSLKKFSYL